MSKSAAATAPKRSGFGGSTWIVVGALIFGLVAGAATGSAASPAHDPLVVVASLIGGLWLDALKMTVIPLIMSLLVKGVVGSARMAGEGQRTSTALIWFMGLYLFSALAGALIMPLLLKLFPFSNGSAAAIRAGFAAVNPQEVQGSVAGFADFIRSFIPSNLFEAAANGSILQLVVFSLLFAVALTFVEEERRQPVVTFFIAVSEALLVLIRWILLLAPLGVFMLAFVAGAASGSRVFEALLHFMLLYISVALLMIAVAYAVAVALSRFGAAEFGKAMAPTQAIAFSTQSSTGTLPAMFISAEKLGVREQTADVVLPLAAALFRFTGPAMNLAVVIFVATTLGMPLGFGSYAAGIAVASVATISAPGLPGQVSYFTSIAPIAMAMGVPIAPLGMLIAVEPIPDMFRTVGNVTMDVAVTGAVDQRVTRSAA